MNKNLELEIATRAISEATIRFNTLLAHLSRLENEIFSLNTTERHLQENIAILKSGTLIASASEFRKIKQEIEKIKNKVVFCVIDRSNCLKNIDDAEKKLHEFKANYAILTSEQNGKVIQGNFGRKSGQE